MQLSRFTDECTACQARALPAIDRPPRVDENVRGTSFFAPVAE